MEEARNIPDGYVLMPIAPTKEALEVICIKYGLPKHHPTSLHFAAEIYKGVMSETAIDASLNIKGGAE